MSLRNGLLKRILRIGWKLALVAAAVGFIVYRLRFAPVPVAAQVAAVGRIVSEVMGTGTLEPRVQSTVGPRISGLLAQVLTDQGERVTKGQLVATLDDSDQQKQVAMAEAEVEAAKASVNRAAADIASAKASAAYAHSNYERMTVLAPTSAVSKDELEKATELRDVADAQLNRAELAKVEADRQVIKAENTLRYYQQLLADTRIVAPFDGLVVRRTRDPGAIVVPGSEILQIISTDQIWVSAWVDETAMGAVSIAQPARVVFRSEPNKSYTGTVTRTAPLADRETREFLVDVTVKDLPKTWAVGQRAEVYIQTASKDQALLAPQAAIVWQKDKPGLFVNNAGHAAWRNVELGLRSEHGGQMVEISKGLAAGEMVIWPRDPKDAALTEGRTVNVP
jgi:RND family efflux transporter MFP subunit